MKHSLKAGNLSLCRDELLCSGIVTQQYESVNIKINEQCFGVEYNEAVKIKSSASAILTSYSWG